MQNIQQEIEKRLSSLQPQVLEFEDESHLHVGHAGNKGGGHYRLLLVSDAFSNISRLERQRLVKNTLHDLFLSGHIHALSIRAVTPDEYFV